jgi:hypothetical protein
MDRLMKPVSESAQKLEAFQVAVRPVINQDSSLIPTNAGRKNERLFQSLRIRSPQNQ